MSLIAFLNHIVETFALITVPLLVHLEVVVALADTPLRRDYLQRIDRHVDVQPDYARNPNDIVALFVSALEEVCEQQHVVEDHE